MIRFVHEAKIASGKGMEAAQWALERIKFVKKYKDIPPVVAFVNVFGDGGVLTFTCDYKDMEQYAKAHKQAVADPEYTKMADDAAHLFVEGSAKITLMRSL